MALLLVRLADTFLQVKSLDAEGSRQSLLEAQAKESALQQRLDSEQGSLQELERRIKQLLQREDNQHCIEARAVRHQAEVLQG
jgi:hypothetical protein